MITVGHQVHLSFEDRHHQKQHQVDRTPHQINDKREKNRPIIKKEGNRLVTKENLYFFLFRIPIMSKRETISDNQCYRYAPKRLNFLQQKREKKKRRRPSSWRRLIRGRVGGNVTVCLKENICIFFFSSVHFKQKRHSCNQCYRYAPKSWNFLQQKHEKKKTKKNKFLKKISPKLIP